MDYRIISTGCLARDSIVMQENPPGCNPARVTVKLTLLGNARPGHRQDVLRVVP